MGVKTAAIKPQINRFFERITNMIIDRERVKNTFAEYTSGYNTTDPKIKLKIDHTYRVAELCELIARDLKLDEYETDVAWLTGMLHDVGRFEHIYNVTTEELKNSQVSPEVMAAFDERHAVLRSCKKTVVDHVAGHIALTFELVYPISLQIAKERGYLDKMMAFESDNEVTGKQFEEIRAKLNEYVESVRPL